MFNREQIKQIIRKHDLLFPFDSYYTVTSDYKAHLRDKKNNRHLVPGTDYAVHYGHPIKMIHNGKHTKSNLNGLGKTSTQTFYLDGIKFKFIFGHNSRVARSGNKGRGSAVAHAGNSGFVIPAPTQANPYGGTHVHLSLKINGRYVDPQPWIGEMYRYLKSKVEPKPTPEELQVEINRLKSENKALVRRVEAYESIQERPSQIELSGQDLLNINQELMENKTMWQDIKGGAKFWAVSLSIATAITYGLSLSGVIQDIPSATLLTSGIAGAVNLLLSAIDNKWGWW